MISLLSGGLLILLIAAAFAFAYVYYKKNKQERMQKMAENMPDIVFSEKEYKEWKKRGELVLVNTTVSFSADNLKNPADKMQMYYRTVTVGNQIMKLNQFIIADVGEI